MRQLVTSIKADELAQCDLVLGTASRFVRIPVVGAHMRQRLRMTAQKLVKAGFSGLGVHVRYAFQYPHAIERKVLERYLRPEVRCIFDVGANVGQSALAFARDFPHATIYSFEPFSSVFAHLKAAVAQQANVVARNTALGSAETELDAPFDGDSTSQMNRLVQPAVNAPHVRLTERVKVETVDGFCASHGIEHIDVLKTDTEGYDADVLRGAERMLKGGQVSTVITEAGFIGDTHHTPFSDTYALLRGHGFQIAGTYEMSYFRDGRCNFCNVVYAKV